MNGRFCSVAKVGCYCESITHSTERRKDGEVKVIQLSLRVEPFDAKLATAIASSVRATLFKLSSAEPHDHLRRVSFGLGVNRQRLTVFATPDTQRATIALDQVKVSDVYARAAKDARTYALIFKAVFGPPGARELEFAEHWRNGMAFVTFEAAEPSADFDEPGDDEEEDDDNQLALPEPEFDTEADGRPVEADAGDSPATRDARRSVEAARNTIHSHADGRRRRANKGVH